jgi:hypothetical protein
MLVVYETN